MLKKPKKQGVIGFASSSLLLGGRAKGNPLASLSSTQIIVALLLSFRIEPRVRFPMALLNSSKNARRSGGRRWVFFEVGPQIEQINGGLDKKSTP